MIEEQNKVRQMVLRIDVMVSSGRVAFSRLCCVDPEGGNRQRERSGRIRL